MFELSEVPDSRSFSPAAPSYTMRYRATGEADELLVHAYATAGTAVSVFTTVGTLYRQDVQLEPDGNGRFMVTVPYGPRSRETGQATFTFDTSGATVKCKIAREHIATYPAGGDADPHKGSIGVKGDGDVEGVDIIIPALKLSYSFKHPLGIVNEAHAKLLAAATGCTNSVAWRSFDAGELLFLGASGGDGTEAEAELTYNFIAEPNKTGLSFGAYLGSGGITGVAKGGHHYLWAEFEETVDADDGAATKPKRVNIDRVYDAVDFAAYFGWE